MTSLRAPQTPPAYVSPSSSLAPQASIAPQSFDAADAGPPQDGWWYRVAACAARLNPTAHLLRGGLLPPLYGYGIKHASRGAHASVVTLVSPQGHPVDCRLYTPRHAAAPNRLVVGFHGNCSTADSLDATWRWTSHFGAVLAVNLPGYGATPAPDDRLQLELRMAANVQAVIAWAQAQGYAPHDITWAGMSLGASQATIGFSMLPGSHLLLINAFTQVGHVAAHCARSLGVFAWPLVWQATASALPDGWRTPGVDYQTDRLNNVKKLEACRHTHPAAGSRVLVLAAENDEVMAPEYPAILQQAYYGDDENKTPWQPYVISQAGHNNLFWLYDEARDLVQDFLCADDSEVSSQTSRATSSEISGDS